MYECVIKHTHAHTHTCAYTQTPAANIYIYIYIYVYIHIDGGLDNLCVFLMKYNHICICKQKYTRAQRRTYVHTHIRTQTQTVVLNKETRTYRRTNTSVCVHGEVKHLQNRYAHTHRHTQMHTRSSVVHTGTP